MLERIGDEASKTEDHEKTLAAYSAALSLDPPSPDILLIKWASTMLLLNSTHEVLDVATGKVCPPSHPNFAH